MYRSFSSRIACITDKPVVDLLRRFRQISDVKTI